MSKITLEGNGKDLVLHYYAKLSEHVILDQITNEVEEKVREEARDIGKKLAEMYAIEIVEQVREAVAREIGKLELPTKK